MRYLSSPVATSLEETAAALERWMQRQDLDGLSQWAVFGTGFGGFVGSCGIHQAQWGGPGIEVAYMFGRRYWGRGYATEAARACLTCAFDERSIDRIIAFVLAKNTASIRVAEKLGMRLDGIVRPIGMTSTAMRFHAKHPNPLLQVPRRECKRLLC